jgi:hypothetical protein
MQGSEEKQGMAPPRRLIGVSVVAAIALVALAAAPAAAQAKKPGEIQVSEAEHLVPPQGGAYEVPIHAGSVCILSFPEKMAAKALTSSPDFEIKGWGDDGVAVRPTNAKAAPATLALATASGSIKINVTLRVVPASQPALTLVRFKAGSADEAFRAAVEAEVQKRTAPMQAELDRAKAGLDQKVRDRADGTIARRLLARMETVAIKARERNGDNVIVHVQRAVFLGEDAYLMFEIENRSGAAYRLAKVEVTSPGGGRHAGPASLASGALDAADGVIGVVAAGSRGRAAVVLRAVDQVLGKPLTLTVEGPDGRGRVVVGRGIVLR